MYWPGWDWGLVVYAVCVGVVFSGFFWWLSGSFVVGLFFLLIAAGIGLSVILVLVTGYDLMFFAGPLITLGKLCASDRNDA
ncbi:MAG: hypothetical protein ACREVR_17160, partial [Burkholderiales bacterium]